jgi:Flp pilus assembly protein TadD
MLGVVAGLYDYNWEEAGRRFRMALAHDPVPPAVRDLYTFYLLPTGRPQEAVEEIERALKEDPLAVVRRAHFAVCLQAAGRDAEADAQWRQALELDENLLPVILNIGLNHALQGRLAEAIVYLEKAYSLAPSFPVAIAGLAGVLRRTGRPAGRKRYLRSCGPATPTGCREVWRGFTSCAAKSTA